MKGNRSRGSRSGDGGSERFRARRTSPSPVNSSSSSSWRPRWSVGADTAGGSHWSSRTISSIREEDSKDEFARSPLIGPALVGTCPDMCPEKERAQRERLRDLSVFERFNGNPARTSPNLAVKKFCRTMSAMHVQTSDIRPPSVLQKTLEYLLSLIDSPTHSFEVIYDFIFDRTRSIRQDLSVQQITNYQAIHMYEEMVEFHIISNQKLARCSVKPDASSLHHLNVEQLIKCLLSLLDMYDVARWSNQINKNEAEFYSFYVLLHLGCKIPTMGQSLSSWFRQVPFPILKSKEVRLARTLLRYSRMGDYKHFFSTLAFEASYLQLCLIEPFLNEVRVQAISFINFSGYKLHPYPLVHLSEQLMIKEQELESLCHACGLETCTDETGSKLLPTKQTGFALPNPGSQSYGLRIPDRC